MNKMKLKFNHERFNKDMKRVFTLLTVVTNCFIISGVIHHWKPRARPIYKYTDDNTKLATPFKEGCQTKLKPQALRASRERRRQLIKASIEPLQKRGFVV